MPFQEADAALLAGLLQVLRDRFEPGALKPGEYEVAATLEGRVNGLHASFAVHGQLTVGPRRGIRWKDLRKKSLKKHFPGNSRPRRRRRKTEA